MQDIGKETMKHCLCSIIATSFFLTIQLHILPCITPEYMYLTMPVYLKLLSSLCGAMQWWLPAFLVVILFAAYIRLRRPAFFDAFLLKAPFIKAVMLPLYGFLFFWAKLFTKDDALAWKAADNPKFAPDDEAVMSTMKEDYPLLYAAIEKRGEAADDDYAEAAEYAKKVFTDACFDFRELVAYACIAMLMVTTLLMAAVYLN